MVSSVAAPPYTDGAPPPSYNKVVKNIEAAAGNNPTPKQCLHIIDGLSAQDRKILADHATAAAAGSGPGAAPPIPEHLKEKVMLGIAQGLAKPEGQSQLRNTATEIARAAANIKQVFRSLKLKIYELDKQAQSDFLPQLEEYENTFSSILRASRELAVDISQHGESFDELVLPVTANQTLTAERRLQIINDHIGDAARFRDNAQKMQGRFSRLVLDFEKFVGRFNDWAKTKEGELDKRITTLNDEIKDLQHLLSDLEKSLYGMGAGVVVGTLAMKFASLTGPAAPFITGLGAIIAGGSAVALVGLGIKFAEVKKEIETKQAERDACTAEKTAIVAARGELVKLGKEQFKEFAKNIDFLASYWQCTDNDAQAVKGWLEKGAKNSDLPAAIRISMNESVKIYKTMATYLKAYADGLPSV